MRELVVEEELQIAYHVPTMMINFTHIAEAIGWKGAYSKKMAKPAILRDVSHEKLGGTYIDKETCESFLNSGDYGLLLPVDQLESGPNPLLAHNSWILTPKNSYVFPPTD
jgi:hypothetical protein